MPLRKAARMEPDKTSIREALGRAYFRSRHFEEAAVEFAAVVERAPTNDYALFCLGRALMECGRPADARQAAGARRRPCARTAATTASTATAHAPRRRDGTRPLRCYNSRNSFRGPQWGRAFESGRSPAFLLEVKTTMSSAIQAEIESRLAAVEPDVEVLLAEVVGGKLVRVCSSTIPTASRSSSASA